MRQLSAERVRDEWFKGLASARDPAELVRMWREAGAAQVWLPELPEPASWPGAAALPRDPVLLTVLYTSDPMAVLRRLKASNAEIGRAAALVQGPAAPAGNVGADVRRWLARVGDAADDHLAMHRLRHGAELDWAAAVRGVRDRGEAVSRGQLAIGGAELQQLGLSGPRVGEVLAILLDRVLEEPALNTRERLLELARALP